MAVGLSVRHKRVLIANFPQRGASGRLPLCRFAEGRGQGAFGRFGRASGCLPVGTDARTGCRSACASHRPSRHRATSDRSWSASRWQGTMENRIVPLDPSLAQPRRNVPDQLLPDEDSGQPVSVGRSEIAFGVRLITYRPGDVKAQEPGRQGHSHPMRFQRRTMSPDALSGMRPTNTCQA